MKPQYYHWHFYYQGQDAGTCEMKGGRSTVQKIRSSQIKDGMFGMLGYTLGKIKAGKAN